MRKIKIKDALLLILFIILLFVAIYVVSVDQKNKNLQLNKMILVDNSSTFFTIEGCVNKYVNALSSSNPDDLVKLLDQNYMKENGITKDNVEDKIGYLDGIYTFSAKKMYRKNISDIYTKYYVYGKIRQDIIDEYDLGEDYYVIVTVNNKSNLFSVTPYDGKYFKEGFDEEN